MPAIPIALKTDTIVECTFETRFAVGNPSAGELLPGMLFEKLRSHFLRTNPLPLAQLPKFVRDQNPQLIHQPTHMFEGQDLRMMVGERVVALSFPKPYPGWSRVQARILECIRIVLGTGLTGSPERFSLKYINVLNHGTSEGDLTQLKLQLALDDFTLRPSATSLRAEIDRNDCINIVEVFGGATVTVQKSGAAAENYTGVVLAVDTVRNGPFKDYSAELPELLEIAHATEKEIFFGLLSQATLAKLGPKYATEH